MDDPIEWPYETESFPTKYYPCLNVLSVDSEPYTASNREDDAEDNAEDSSLEEASKTM